MRVSNVLLCIVSLLVASRAVAQESLKPVVLSPDHNHTRFGVEPAEHVLEFRAYTASFDVADDDNGDGQPDVLGVSGWVAYQLNKGGAVGSNERPRDWIGVPNLPSTVASPSDESYANSGFSRGHMCMRSHAHRLGSSANFNTFCVANACPQLQPFNGGHWLGLEKLCGVWADTYKRIWIVCGPVFDANHQFEFIGDNNEVEVAIPDGFYKIVVRENELEPEKPLVLAFVYPHDTALNNSSLSVDHAGFLTSVRAIEAATGLGFFASLPVGVQDEIEGAPADDIWEWDLDDNINALMDSSRRGESFDVDLLMDMIKIRANRLDAAAALRVEDEPLQDAAPAASAVARRIRLNDLRAVEPSAALRASDSAQLLVGSWNLKWFFDHDTSDDNSEIGPDQAARSRRAFFARVEDVAEVIADIKPTVIALQEIENRKVVRDIANELREGHGQRYNVAFVQGFDTFTGQDVAYLVDSRVQFRQSRFTFEPQLEGNSRFKNLSKHCRLRFEFGGERFEIVNVHLTTRPAARLRQARTLREWTRDSAGQENLILIGDFNIHVRFEDTQRHDDIGIIRGLNTPGERDDLVDLHASLRPRSRATHRGGSHLDRVLVSSRLADNSGFRFSRIENLRRRSGSISDHFPLVATFSKSGPSPEPLAARRLDRATTAPNAVRDTIARAAGHDESLSQRVTQLEDELSAMKELLREILNKQDLE